MPSEQDETGDWRLAGPRRPDLVRDETLATMFAETVSRTPDKHAISMLGSAAGLTYRELDARATQLAAALLANGVVQGDCVGLWFRRSIDLHVAILATQKAGVSYIPFDAETPADRVAKCLADCGAWLLLTHASLGDAPDRLNIVVARIETLVAKAGNASPVFPAPDPDAVAYIIYTSGSTGEPKGIAVTQRNVCHYVRSVNETLAITSDDVVLQQASAAFDLSIEEIFVPYLVGATIKVADDTALRELDRLADRLERDRITVIDAVPTLLLMLDRRPNSVRLAIVGGEACPETLIERFAGNGCHLMNTYGPTEATVVATAAELFPGKPVTIGRPLANYTAYVVGEDLTPVARGGTGELLIGGPSVTRGYVGRADLTAARFIANPFGASGGDPVLYRTGDAVSIDAAGQLLFHGRIDAQVKIRGYRIELGEIEALLSAEPGVRTAVVVATHRNGLGDALVAHVATGPGFDHAATKRALQSRLPAYMLPTFWRQHVELPQLRSGKVDRKALAALSLDGISIDGVPEEPASSTEGHLLRAARAVLGLPVIDLEADFFTGLGGHSLLAAQLVSEIRKQPHLASVSLQDLYAARSMRKLGRLLDERRVAVGSDAQDLSFVPPPLWRRFLCGLAQAIALPFIIVIVTAQWIGLLLASIYLVRDDLPLWLEALLLCSIYVGLNLGAKLTVVLLKRLVIGRVKPGVYPLWGAAYFRIWLVQRLVHLSAPKFLQGSPLMRLYLRALGAKVGRDAIIHEFEEGAIDLIEIGPRASIGSKVRFANAEVIGNQIHVGRIVIGADAYVGNACVIAGNAVIGDKAELGDLTALTAGQQVASGEKWDGSPARRVGFADTGDLPPQPVIGPIRRGILAVGYFAAYNIIMMVGLLPIFPAFYILTHLDAFTFGTSDNVVPWAWVPVFAWPAALVLVFASMLVVVIMRWVIMPRRVRPGRHSIHSWFYFRKWMMTLSTEAMLETLNSLYATVFMRNWYRLLGTKVGRGTEISANFAGRYDLITLGANNFIGDETIFGDEEIRGGWMIMSPVTTGDRCFFGNLSVVAKGATIETDALLGVKSRLPDSLRIEAGETWFGSPAISIPNRQRVALAANWTYQPPLHKRLARTLFEALHTSLPTAVLITLAYITADIIEVPINAGHWGTALGVFLAAGIVVSMAMMLVSVAFKWLAMGIYRPGNRPMWSWWAMRTEAVSVLYGGLSSKIMLDYVRGTPFLPWLLRLYGTRIGRGTYINCADLTEFDCVQIGDFSVINMHATPQTHLYEDRVMKVGRIAIGRGVTLGSGALVLYDSKIGDYVQLAPLTVVMKGEVVPAHTIWAGAPSTRVAAPVAPVAVTPRGAACCSASAVQLQPEPA